ncbi:spore cortex-lytic enzyme [Rhodobiaceae bacterium]|nr:spore cortex-lytic enzyme [Rhodobiaceae bacterium]
MSSETLLAGGLFMIAAALAMREQETGTPTPSGVSGAVTTLRDTVSPSVLSGFDFSSIFGPKDEPQKVASVSHDVDILARTLWGEARGENREGREAVASVIMNRVASSRYPDAAAKVCQQNKQFSVWNFGDPNRAKILAVTVGDPVFKECLAIAERAVSGSLIDKTGGATHYHTTAIRPYWAEEEKISARIGSHIFYRGIA